MKEKLSPSCIKSLRVKKETINEKRTPKTISLISTSLLLLVNNFSARYTLESAIEGILNITDIMMASFLLKSKNRAPVMEAPDLLVPGNTAKDCQTPIIKASFLVISESLRWLTLLSDVKSSIANNILVNAMISKFLVRSIALVYSKTSAINIKGSVAKIIKNIDFLKPFFSKTIDVFSFKGLATSKITASKLPI